MHSETAINIYYVSKIECFEIVVRIVFSVQMIQWKFLYENVYKICAHFLHAFKFLASRHDYWIYIKIFKKRDNFCCIKKIKIRIWKHDKAMHSQKNRNYRDIHFISNKKCFCLLALWKNVIMYYKPCKNCDSVYEVETTRIGSIKINENKTAFKQVILILIL